MYIFAGKRNKEYLNDFFTYEVDTHLVDHICINDLGNRDASQISQDAGFTHRATIDPDLDEIYVLSVCKFEFTIVNICLHFDILILLILF